MSKEDTSIDLGSDFDATQMTDEQLQAAGQAMEAQQEAERLAARGFYERLQDYCMPIYMCTAMGHKFHVTETICLIVFLLSLGGAYLMMKGAKFNDAFMALAVFCISLGGVAFIWGYLDISSLSEQANALQVVAAKSEQEREQFEKINEALTEQTDLFMTRVNQLGNEVGLIQDGVNKLGSLIGPIQSLQNAMVQLNEQQIEIGDAQDALVAEQEQATKDQELDMQKATVKQIFRYIANNPESVLQGDADIENLKEAFRRRNLVWTEKCDEAVADKRVYKYEMLAVMDEVLKTRYYRLRDAPKEREVYEKLQAVRTEELKSLATRLSIPHSKIRILRPIDQRSTVVEGVAKEPSVIELALAKEATKHAANNECKLETIASPPSSPRPPQPPAPVATEETKTPPPRLMLLTPTSAPVILGTPAAEAAAAAAAAAAAKPPTPLRPAPPAGPKPPVAPRP